jgi:hypothetical protein
MSESVVVTSVTERDALAFSRISSRMIAPEDKDTLNKVIKHLFDACLLLDDVSEFLSFMLDAILNTWSDPEISNPTFLSSQLVRLIKRYKSGFYATKIKKKNMKKQKPAIDKDLWLHSFHPDDFKERVGKLQQFDIKTYVAVAALYELKLERDLALKICMRLIDSEDYHAACTSVLANDLQDDFEYEQILKHLVLAQSLDMVIHYLEKRASIEFTRRALEDLAFEVDSPSKALKVITRLDLRLDDFPQIKLALKKVLSCSLFLINCRRSQSVG